MLGVRWAEDLSLAPVGQPEDREPAVLVLERGPKDISVETLPSPRNGRYESRPHTKPLTNPAMACSFLPYTGLPEIIYVGRCTVGVPMVLSATHFDYRCGISHSYEVIKAKNASSRTVAAGFVAGLLWSCFST